MRAAGWTKDVNVRFDYRRGGTDPQHAASAAADVAALNPDLVVAIGSPVVVAMQHVTTTIPIVFAVVSDPVGQGLVPNLAHPGGNITGFSNLEPLIGGKWLELLKKIAPTLTKVAVMFNPATSPYNKLFERSVENGAPTFGVQVLQVPAHDDAEVAAAFERLAGQPDTGLLVPSDAFTYFRSATIVALAAKHRLPAIYAFRRFTVEGGLISYGVDAFEQMRATASYLIESSKAPNPATFRCRCQPSIR
jgi:putative ABC transport system substrate-binding protein